MASRENLKKHKGEKIQFTATIGISSRTNGVNYICLTEVKRNYKDITDHIWVRKCFRFKNLREGQIIKFTATIFEYESVNKNGEVFKKFGMEKIRRVKFVESSLLNLIL